MNILNYKKNIYSQNGEDGIIEFILNKLEKDLWCCEFGAWDGKHLSNTFNLVKNHGYNAVFIEPDDTKYMDLMKTCEEFNKIVPVKRMVDSKNNLLDDILSETNIPKNFDILSIDVDSIDYAIWKSVEKYEPKVVVIEINSSLDPEILYNDYELTENVLSTRTGVNFKTCYELGKSKNYSLLCHTGNMIFIHNDFKKLFESYSDDNFLEAFDTRWR